MPSPRSEASPQRRAAARNASGMTALKSPPRCTHRFELQASSVLAPDVIRARSCRDLVVMMEPTEDRPRDDPTRIRAGCPWCYGWYGNLLADPLVRSEGIEVL